MRIFIDSSALAKRYVREAGTEKVLSWCREAEEIVLSALCAPELISGFNRLKRERKLSASQYRGLKRDLAADVQHATIVDLAPSVISRTIACLERKPLRTLDAIHLASALESLCDVFITADHQQYKAAAHFNIKVEMTEGQA